MAHQPYRTSRTGAKSCLRDGCPFLREKQTLPTGRGGLSTAAIGHQIYNLHEMGSPAVVPNGVHDNVEAYDTIADIWETLPPLPVPRHSTSAASIGAASTILERECYRGRGAGQE